MAKLKVGKISNKEKEFIRLNKANMSDTEMAEELGRSPDFVTKYRVGSVGSLGVTPKHTDVADAKAEVRQKLKDSYTWLNLKKEFTGDELNHFIENYVEITAQFKGDVTATEELQIIQVCKFEVLMSRELIARKSIDDKIEELEKELSDLPPFEDMSEAERDRRSHLNDRVQNYRANSINSYSSFIKFEEKKEGLLTKLKATRDQRISKIDSVKVSWIDVIKQLANEETRDIIGMQISMSHKTYEKEYKRLSKPHTFINGTSELPLLTSETYHETEDATDLGENNPIKIADSTDSGTKRR